MWQHNQLQKHSAVTHKTTEYNNSAKSTDDKRNSFQGTLKSDARGLDMLVVTMVCDSWSYWSRLSGSVVGKRAEAFFVWQQASEPCTSLFIVPWKQFQLSSVLFAASLHLQCLFIFCFLNAARVVKLIYVVFLYLLLFCFRTDGIIHYSIVALNSNEISCGCCENYSWNYYYREILVSRML